MDAALIERLRADLTAARYTVDALGALWGGEADAALERGNRLPALRALAGDTGPRATLANLFMLGMPVAVSAAEDALPGITLSGARELGLCEVRGDSVVALVDLRPYDFLDTQGAGSWWIASDLGELATGRALRTDHVLGVGGASLTLSGLLLPDPVGSVLDLGTGCGIQALHASRWAARVVATDISARALEFARLNAALNGIGNIEFRLGSLFEPVAGERFDRIVSNPPFVITPRTSGVPAYEYRDGGMVGDALVHEVVIGAREHLTAGGIAQLLGNWEYRAEPAASGSDGLQRAAGWADDAGLDAWIIERDRQDPAQYAETWIRDGGTRRGTPEFERLCGAWLDDFAARGVTAVGFGYLLLRHPAPAQSLTREYPRLRRVERLDAPLGRGTAGLGSHLSTAVAAHDWQAPRTDEEVLATRLHVSSDVTEERSHWPGEADPSVLVLRQGGGFRRELRVGTELAAIVGACDGDLPLGAIVTAVAQLLDLDVAELERGTVAEVRELLVDGFLLLETGG
ncbi:MAG: class I SAM-dependent methyltransferase [Actinomycetota bacterium]|nr:class I SAM-dependent methyltransferase [Actinomycetota bacterium]